MHYNTHCRAPPPPGRFSRQPEKENSALAKFLRLENMKGPDWRTIIGLVLPRHSSNEAFSKCKKNPVTGWNQCEAREGMVSVHAGRPDKGFAELHPPGILGNIDEENNQAVDSDMDDPLVVTHYG